MVYYSAIFGVIFVFLIAMSILYFIYLFISNTSLIKKWPGAKLSRKEQIIGVSWGIISWLIAFATTSVGGALGPIKVQAFENPIGILFLLPTYIPFKIAFLVASIAPRIYIILLFGVILPVFPITFGLILTSLLRRYILQ